MSDRFPDIAIMPIQMAYQNRQRRPHQHGRQNEQAEHRQRDHRQRPVQRDPAHFMDQRNARYAEAADRVSQMRNINGARSGKRRHEHSARQ